MRERKIYANIWPAETLCRLLASAGLLLVVSAGTARAQVKDLADWVPVSINAGETYVINDIKPGTKPSFKVEQNPNAFVSYDSPPGKLTMLSAAAGRWIVTVTNTSDRDVSYDVNAFAVAKPGAPLTPGKAPRSLSDEGLDSRPGAGASTSTPSATPELATISSSSTPSSPVPYSVTLPAKTPSYNDATWSVPPQPGSGVQAYEPGQSVGPLESRAGQYRNDPSVLDSGSGYSSDTVSGGKHYMPADAISLMMGTSEVIDFQRRVTRISVADSKIADVQVIDPFQLNLVAHQPGFTTLAVWDANGRYQERTVRIDASGRQQVMLNTIVAELDRQKLENQGINLSVAFSKMGLSLVGLPGTVATPYNASSTLQSSASSGSLSGTTSPNGVLPAGGQIIPLLLSSTMTYGLAAQNADVMWQAFFQFLENHSLGKILAEPHLLANSGEKAKFLSGGEIPIVIAQALNSTIVFKTYGTSVEFIPTVVGRDDIELLVKPEVSQPDFAQGVSLFGFTVPAFVTRRAETMVRLKDRQTLILAGLILHQKTSQVQKVPYLGDIPWVRGLFRTTSYSDQESDLVMSVTPEIIRPLPQGGQVFLPTNRGELSAEEIKTKPIEPPDAARPRF
ncbi:MAG TPA: pilus assembly protein N-terminal domain-containing protein [Candidatus Binatus sp.]|uniref:type II and III secretion system protein family protein n=1 Tax=Candidatus Binatus sp. TaxID=2811406 RepID=UPI002B467B74|nr:pilus assembly protein N-terminal domain-containing protein [Candidatus Binatus sp.]HKN13159.1 pilus assembly protein N-terminal domain-containing protein [Candidatus Binatus sp.]